MTFTSPSDTAGKWDDPDASLKPPLRCRWFFSWTEYAPGQLAGFFAGYEGGGAFVEERFHAVFSAAKLQRFVWNGREHVTGADVSAEPMTGDVERLGDHHFDVFIDWHDRTRWEDGFLCLAEGRSNGLTMLPNALFLPPADTRSMERVAAMVRCTGILCRFPDTDL